MNYPKAGNVPFSLPLQAEFFATFDALVPTLQLRLCHYGLMRLQEAVMDSITEPLNVQELIGMKIWY